MSLVVVALTVLKPAGLELAIRVFLGWCLIHSTTKLLLRKQFWNFPINCEVEESGQKIL
jgi:hypothetical protein